MPFKGEGMFVNSVHERTHVRTLRGLAALLSLLSLLLASLAASLPLFDSSPKILLAPSTLSSIRHVTRALFRWDGFHFAHIAMQGYTYEHEWAFFPGAPVVMRVMARFISFLLPHATDDSPTYDELLLGGLLATSACSGATTLYRLTMHHTKSANIAFLASLLSLLPSSPVTLRLAPYTEPFFTYLSYRGRSPYV